MPRSLPIPGRLALIVLCVVQTVAAVAAVGLLQPAGLGNGLYHADGARPLVALSAGLLAVAAVAAVIGGARPRVALAATALAGATCLLLATAVLGGHAWDIACALLTLSACWAVGHAVLQRAGAQRYADIAPVAFSLGAGVLGLVVFALGKTSLLYWWSAGLLVAGLGLWGLIHVLREIWNRRVAVTEAISGGSLEVTAFVVLCLAFSWVLIYTAAPEVTYDALYAKAWLPQHWASVHRIDAMFQHPVMGTTGFAQILATPGHLLGSDAIGRYLQLIAWVALATTVWWFGRSRGAIGPLAAVCAVVVPGVLWQATTANDDLLLSLVILGLALAILESPKERSSDLRHALVIGALAGTAVMFKLHLLPLTALLVLGWIGSAGVAAVWTRFAGVLGGGGAIAGPVLVQRWAEYGNPVFPVYNNVFRSPHYAPVAETFNFPYWVNPSLTDTVLAPWTVIAHPDRLNDVSPPGMFGALVGAIILLLLLGWRRWGGTRSVIVPWLAVGVAVLVWWVSLRYLRYLLPAGFLSLLAIVMIASPQRLSRRGAAIAGALAVVTAITALPAFVPISYMIPGHKPPVAAAFGRWNTDDYYRHAFPERDAVMAFNRIARPGAMAVGPAHQRAWLTGGRDLTPGWELLRRLSLRFPGAALDGPDITRQIQALGVDWIVTNMGEPVSTALVAAGAEPVYGDHGWTVLRLSDARASGRPASCDPLFTGADADCWTGATLDRNPGLRWVEDYDGLERTLVSCPGQIIELAATTAPGGAASTVTATAPSADPRAGATQVTIAPGSTGHAYLTVPAGATSVTIRAVPGQDGTLKSLTSSVRGVGCPSRGHAA